MFWPCVHFPALRAKKDISKFSFSSGSSFPKLSNLWVETQSRDPAARATEEHWDYEEEAVPYHRRSHHEQVRPFKKALTILLSSIAAFAAVKHEPCTVLSSTSRRQRTINQCVELSNWMWDVQEVSNLGSIWVLETGSKAHCILSVAFGFTVLVLLHQHHFVRFQ